MTPNLAELKQAALVNAIRSCQLFTGLAFENLQEIADVTMRGYLAWKRGDAVAAAHLLEETRAALGKEWQPKGATSEGDVKQKQHIEKTPLTQFWEGWDGASDLNRSFAPLDAALQAAR